MSHDRMTRREFLRWSVVGAGSIGIAACMAAPPAALPSAETTGQNDEPDKASTQLVWWHGWGGPSGLAAMTAIEDAFNTGDHSFQIERVHVDEMNQKILVAIAGGTPPDIGVCCAQYAQLYSRNAVVPLDDYIDASIVIKRDAFVQGLFESMQWLGKTYGVPAIEAGPRYGIMYNNALIAEAGLEAANFPTTWDEMYEWHVALSKFDSAGNVSTIGFDPRDGTSRNGPATNIPQFWAINYGLDAWDSETLTFHYDRQEYVEALATIKRFYDYVGVEQMESLRSSTGTWVNTPSAQFPAGILATLNIGYYGPGELAINAPDKEFGVAWVPVPEARSGIKMQSVGGIPAYIPVGSKDPDRAFEFIEFLTTDAVQTPVFEATGWLGGRKEWYDPDLPRYAGRDVLRWYLQSVNEADEMWACPVIPIQAFVEDQREKTYAAVIFGEKTPEQAAIDMHTACTEELRNEFPDLVTE
ncbi:MAG: extracellular solute-binding protein [Caldilineaceae bacterium]|nr:extracellular solute-binding protein [Caldilineaceae bacterium]